MYKEGVLDSQADGRRVPDAAHVRPLWPPAVGTYVQAASATGLIDLMAWNADGTRMA